MATISKLILSGSTDGKLISIGAGATTIHDAHASALDEVWVWANNTTAAGIDLTITDGTKSAVVTITAKSTVCILPGTIFTNSVNVDASQAGGADAILVFGFVNRIT